jgi:hypothetical protein
MTRIRIQRTLPTPGEILVGIGEHVDAWQKIARIPTNSEIRVVNVAQILGLDTPDLSRVMVKRRGDRVEAGEILAARRGVIPLWHKPCRSPIAGRLAAIGPSWVVIKAESETVDLLAFVAGQVTDITDHRSVIIEMTGTHIAGACGVGGEGTGYLKIPVDDPSYTLTVDDIGLGFNNAILVGGATVSPQVLDRAREMKIRGIIVGSISASLHDSISNPPFPIVATEGYGNLPMSRPVFDILKQFEGHKVFISGQGGGTQDSARPTIIIPLEQAQEGDGHLSTSTPPDELTPTSDQPQTVSLSLLG